MVPMAENESEIIIENDFSFQNVPKKKKIIDKNVSNSYQQCFLDRLQAKNQQRLSHSKVNILG